MSLLFNQTWLNERLLPNYTHTHTYIYRYIYIYDSLPTKVKNDPKGVFPVATKSRRRGGCYSFPWIAPLTLDHILLYWVFSKDTSSRLFEDIGMIRPGIEPWSFGSLANTQTIMLKNSNDDVYIQSWVYENEEKEDPEYLQIHNSFVLLCTSMLTYSYFKYEIR